MTYAEYASRAGVSASRLKLMAQSPLHSRHYERRDPASRGMLRAVPAFVLEPERADFVVYDGVRRGKEYDRFAAANEGRTILNVREHDVARSIAEGSRRPPISGPLLAAPGRSEVSVYWTDSATGLKCRGRLDRVVDGPPAIVDLKTYGTSDPRVIARRVAQGGAHIQAAHYCDGLAATTGVALAEIRYLLISAESAPPFDVAVLELEFDNALALGRAERDRLMRRLASCIERDEWPGRCPEIVALEMPAWADPLLAEEPSIDLEGAS